jgi:hypothetical protein
VTALLVPRRFRGPPSSGNGGWTAGALAGLMVPAPSWGPVGATVEVTLHAPPPLDRRLPVTTEGDLTVASDDDRRIATARRVDTDLTPVAPVRAAAARAATASYPGHRAHPFPSCFSCGTGREEGDGLRIFPGRTDTGAVAATWTPHPGLASLAVTWAALDCTGAWAADFGDRPMVLGRITARIDALPAVGGEHVVVGEERGREGRKTATATSLYDAAGRLVGTAEHVWITVDPAQFG